MTKFEAALAAENFVITYQEIYYGILIVNF